jgi:signal peptidase I
MKAERTDPTRRRPVRWAAVLLALLLTPVAGYVAIGRHRRAMVWLAAVGGYMALGVAAVLLGRAPLLYGAVVLALLHGLVAVADVARLSRRGPYQALGRPAAMGAGALLVIAGLGLALRVFVVGSFRVSHSSMIPTIEVGDHFLVNKLVRQVRRGDVIVFRYPPNPMVHYVMRVVAVAGDSVAVEEGELLINGQPPHTQRLGVEQRIDPVMGQQTVERWKETIDGRSYTVYRRAGPMALSPATDVPAGHVFVMGDNRDNANDSRTWGTLPLDLLRGRALFIWWSSDKTGGVRRDRLNQQIK